MSCTFFSGYAQTSNTQEEVDRINNFVEAHKNDLQGSITSIEDSLKTANLNIAWNQDHAEKVLEWLDENDNDDDNSATIGSHSLFLFTFCIISYHNL